ncbi:MAG: four-carbon acid sugar kinase family protein, partial [Treponema sp.]|nr:four-carbon acid sugar kinase family protein [Treponema sp.]
EEMSAFTQKTMGRIAAQILGEAKISGLFLSGGDTAMGCFESLGALGSNITGEISLGIPLMSLIGGPYEGVKAATKAGAFGKEDAIFYALRALKAKDIA